ncbi:MAG: hypothetical protein NT140_05930 [Deltaproteobacteria bacterium]|nr:hypothetical protein [Deltaproteobacteria bacterium]
MLQFLKKLFFKDRKDHRHLIHNGIIVVITPTKHGNTIQWKVNVVDISHGGAAFVYEGSPRDLAKQGLIKFSDNMPEAADFRTVSDIESSPGSSYRRRGVKFEWKGVLGEKQFIKFVKEHGIHDRAIYTK